MLVIPGGLDVIVETRNGAGGSYPGARLGASGAVIKVVVDKDVLRHVPLHLELATADGGSIVFIECVVDQRRVLGPATVGCISPNGNACRVAVIDKVIPSGDVASGSVLVLTSQLNPEVHIMNRILLDQDSGPTVHVNAVGRLIIAVCGIAA